jgi:hypothetical protein
MWAKAINPIWSEAECRVKFHEPVERVMAFVRPSIILLSSVKLDACLRRQSRRHKTFAERPACSPGIAVTSVYGKQFAREKD